MWISSQNSPGFDDDADFDDVACVVELDALDALDAVPAELRRLPQWILWADVDGRKLPRTADGRRNASTTDPATWTTFEAAAEAFREAPPGRFSGLGFVFTEGDPYVGIDLDGCLDGGEIADWARPWLDRFKGCYAEVSPSGRGVKVWARGKLPGRGCRRKADEGEHTAIEVYDRGRYFAVTADVLGRPEGAIPERQEVVDDLYRWIKEESSGTPPAKRTGGLRVRDTSGPLTDEQRASAYLAKVDPAVSGQDGHGTTFRAAMIGPGFDLAPDVAFRLLWDEYNSRCVPPWTEREIRHKVDQAYKAENRRGWMLDAGEGRPGQGAAHAAVEIVDEVTGLTEAVDNDYRLARVVLAMRFAHPDGPTLRFWRGEWHTWRGGEWKPTPDVEVNAVISAVCRAEFVRHARDEGKPVRGVGTRLVGNVAAAIRDLVILPEHEFPHQPAWLSGTGPEPSECLNCRNGILHLPTLIDEGPEAALTPPTPRFWTANVLDYDFDPDAPKPVEWFRFLDSLWPNDPESIQALQQWFGYLLTPDTSQHKALMIVGRPRSGKGTIARLLASLVGETNTAAPTLTSLGTQFGLQCLIGKSVAFCGETRLTARSDGSAIVETVLSISGEDEQSIERKHTTPWRGRLRVRFIFSANELPRLADFSKALLSRLTFLKLTESFEGREDRDLEAKLRAERPGILLWAAVGWGQLQESGRFLQPSSAWGEIQEMEALSDPIGLFVSERCEAGPDLVDADGGPASIPAKRLYDAWCGWCQENGRDHKKGDTAWFGTRLKASLPFVERYQRRIGGGGREHAYRHIRLASGY